MTVTRLNTALTGMSQPRFTGQGWKQKIGYPLMLVAGLSGTASSGYNVVNMPYYSAKQAIVNSDQFERIIDTAEELRNTPKPLSNDEQAYFAERFCPDFKAIIGKLAVRMESLNATMDALGEEIYFRNLHAPCAIAPEAFEGVKTLQDLLPLIPQQVEASYVDSPLYPNTIPLERKRAVSYVRSFVNRVSEDPFLQSLDPLVSGTLAGLSLLSMLVGGIEMSKNRRHTKGSETESVKK